LFGVCALYALQDTNIYEVNWDYSGFILGVSPKAYLKANRMKYAYDLITETEYPIKLIAKKCGFKYVGNFCSAFKKWFGKTAGSFRGVINLLLIFASC
jgi:AraC-like DNA-binding protein